MSEVLFVWPSGASAGRLCAVVAALVVAGSGCASPNAASSDSGGAGAGGAASGAGGDGSGAGAGSGGQAGSAGCGYFASEVTSVSFGSGQNFGQNAMPGIVLGPPHGKGLHAGSLDVASLGNGGVVTLGFGAGVIEDGPGPDFVVFENAFVSLSNPDVVFAELASVAVSADGIDFVPFPCSAEDTDPPPHGACAGWHPVLLDGGAGPVDVASSGGDAFDLADVGLAEARFVRITDRVDLASVFDLDAVGIVHARCPL